MIYGAGPVGLMAHSRPGSRVRAGSWWSTPIPDRLALAEKLGAIPIDDSDNQSVEKVLELTGGEGADRGCECVGYQCSCGGHEVPNHTMNNLVKAVRATGGIGVVGVFLPQDPGSPDKLMKQGQLAFDFGQLWSKGHHIGTGQANVKAYNRKLRDLIAADILRPSQIISHELTLDEAPQGYSEFDKRSDGWTQGGAEGRGLNPGGRRSVSRFTAPEGPPDPA